MLSRRAIKLKDCIWIRGDIIDRQTGAAGERRSLRNLGVRVETLKNRHDRAGLTRLRQIIWNTDDHVILSRLMPLELQALYPIFKDRRNYSIVLCDWWTSPYWFTKNAEYLLYNLYNYFAVRSGLAPFARFRDVPLLNWPAQFHWYPVSLEALRVGSLGLCPILELWNRWRRRNEDMDPARMIYFPLAVEKEDVPFRETEIKYDFSNLGGTNGIWLMRDPFGPSYFTGANLYSDRKCLIDLITACHGDPSRNYDVREEKQLIPWEKYCHKARESRFTLSTGGLHEAAVPKYIEFACLGTPMIGRRLPFEFPWLDQCLFPIDPATVTRHNIQAKLNEALSLYPKLRENCLNLREPLLRQYHFETLLQMAQDQIEGKPIPAGYLTPAARLEKPENRDRRVPAS